MDLVVTLNQSYNHIVLRFRDGENDMSCILGLITTLLEAGGENMSVDMTYERSDDNDIV